MTRVPRKQPVYRIDIRKSLFDALAVRLFGSAASASEIAPPLPPRPISKPKQVMESGIGRQAAHYTIDGNTDPRKLKRYLARKAWEESNV